MPVNLFLSLDSPFRLLFTNGVSTSIPSPHWSRFNDWSYRHHDLGLYLDVSRIGLDAGFIDRMSPKIQYCLEAMKFLESGGIANPDEERQVGHYWLRNSRLAPDDSIRDVIDRTLEEVRAFATAIRQGQIVSPEGHRFERAIIVGIGGSALGPQLLADALDAGEDGLQLHFIDNTDPDGIERELARIGDGLRRSLVVVISKSGGTKETRNGMLEVTRRMDEQGLSFPGHMVAVTGEGSKLDQTAIDEGWLKRFPMWDWVGGRTSVMSAVGLLPMALMGLDIDGFLEGAALMDGGTRQENPLDNPALLLALCWYHAGCGQGSKDMVIIPYKDRLVLFSKYLQQLVMESLGKRLDLDGREVFQGIAVYGNKGSTDQHAYVQQLRDGLHNFFLTFIEVRRAKETPAREVEPGITSGDYLQGFLRGTRAALTESGRESLTVSIESVTARSLGALIALYERAVGYYASLIHVNAYHQPGVEAGKVAAGRLLELQKQVQEKLQECGQGSAETIAALIEADPEDVYHVLVHLAANRPDIVHLLGDLPRNDTFRVE
jgi:glucose-6-phosphate isomerase